MGEVGDDRAVHLEVDLDGRTAQFGMRGGAGVGGGQAAEPGDIAGQFDDALVVDVVQHKIEVSGFERSPLAGRITALYMAAMAEIQSGHFRRLNSSQFGSLA